MRILITKSCFQPNGAKVPNILKLGTEHELSDDQAKSLLDKGYAVKKAEKAEDPKEAREKELKKLEAAELDKLLSDKGLPVEGTKPKKIAAILTAEFPAA